MSLYYLAHIQMSHTQVLYRVAGLPRPASRKPACLHLPPLRLTLCNLAAFLTLVGNQAECSGAWQYTFAALCFPCYFRPTGDTGLIYSLLLFGLSQICVSRSAHSLGTLAFFYLLLFVDETRGC